VKILSTADAEQDRNEIFDYIADDNPSAAVRMDTRFAEAVRRLGNHPYMDRIGKIPGTRELIPHENYRVVYEIDVETVRILALVHVTRQWPPDRG